MLDQIRSSDTIVVWKLDRLARSTRDLLETMEAIREAGGKFQSNQARCILTGALSGAQVGLSGIPRRFLDGLENSAELTALACRLGEQAERESVD
jgi:Resolvase, N terminal domain